MADTILQGEKITKVFQQGKAETKVLDRIDIKIFEKDFTVIMGPSGAGKSTLLYALSGMDTPSLGKITFGNEVISSYSSDELAVFRRKHCGFVFQQIYLLDGMSVMDNVLAAGLLTSKDKKKIVEYAKELFRAVDISEETQNKFPTQISGGESQRAGIVRALVNSPRILFADEPTGALNSKTGLDVLNTLTEFNGRGQSIVMVTHDMRSARRGNRILYLKDGSVLGECNLGRYVHGDKERHEKLATFLTEMGW